MLKAPDFGRLGRFEIVLAQQQFHTIAVKKFAWYLRTHYVFRIAPPYRALALGVCFILPVHASSPKPGDFANTQARHIATFFPGRMTGTPAEMLSADYIRQQFQQMGYRSDIRTFNSRYIYTARDNRKSWHNVTGSTVIAAHEGKAPQQIIIMAHLDTYAPLSDADADANPRRANVTRNG